MKSYVEGLEGVREGCISSVLKIWSCFMICKKPREKSLKLLCVPNSEHNMVSIATLPVSFTMIIVSVSSYGEGNDRGRRVDF